ncbi:MAG TPA: hypothetical protein VKQ32_11660 [Polyangia bacterium]|nr:hypothetical protein [Polyangia bacterium]
MSPNEKELLSDEDEVCYAPESGQPPGGRDNPWDDDDETAGAHAFPADHHEPPGDDL